MAVPQATESTQIIVAGSDQYPRSCCPSPCCTFTIASITALASSIFMSFYLYNFIYSHKEQKDASPIVWSILVTCLSLVMVIAIVVRNRFYNVGFKSNQYC